jgi:hypothetical protein
MEKSTKIWIRIFSIWAIIVIASIIWNIKQYPKKLERFQNEELNGIVTYIYSSTGGTRIRLNNEQKKHLIFTEYNEDVKFFFYRFVEIGDSIYKSPNDNYIHVFKDNKETLFRTTKEKPKR